MVGFGTVVLPKVVTGWTDGSIEGGSFPSFSRVNRRWLAGTAVNRVGKTSAGSSPAPGDLSLDRWDSSEDGDSH